MCVGWGGGASVSKGMLCTFIVRMSSQSMRSNYFCYLMENMYAKVNYVCMNMCMHTNLYACRYSFFSVRV